MQIRDEKLYKVRRGQNRKVQRDRVATAFRRVKKAISDDFLSFVAFRRVKKKTAYFHEFNFDAILFLSLINIL